jgi:hypothetical protein
MVTAAAAKTVVVPMILEKIISPQHQYWIQNLWRGQYRRGATTNLLLLAAAAAVVIVGFL